MVPKPAQYILRFDDLCPTVSQRRWQRLEPLIEEFGIRPILGIIPDNRNPTLDISEPDPQFWERMRTLEARGATIAVHGYQHRSESPEGGFLSLHKRSEFAGVSEATQREWIRRGLEILRSHGLNPRLWIAPRHGFDWATLDALRAEGIKTLSDGFARVPIMRGGVTWIPQQLWEPMEKSKGLWTICIHPNTAANDLIEELREFLRRHAAQFTSVDRVLAEFDATHVTLTELACERIELWRTQFARYRKQRVLKQRALKQRALRQRAMQEQGLQPSIKSPK